MLFSSLPWLRCIFYQHLKMAHSLSLIPLNHRIPHSGILRKTLSMAIVGVPHLVRHNLNDDHGT